jgi:tyrosyl-tRNA synthetase
LNGNIVEGVAKQMGRSLDDLHDITYVNNYEFYKDMSAIQFLRDIGKHFRVNSMLAKDSVKSRIESSSESADPAQGMSFTEFSYQIFQGYDFLKLNE